MNPADLDKLVTKHFGLFIVVKLIGKNAVKLGLPIHIKIPLVIHFLHTVRHVVYTEHIIPRTDEKPALIPTIKVEEHFIDRIVICWKRQWGSYR